MKKIDPKSMLRSIFNDTDPQGIFFKDNGDEYDGEIEELLKLLPSCVTSSQVHEALWAIFQSKFKKSAGKKDDYSELAEKVFQWKTDESKDR